MRCVGTYSLRFPLVVDSGGVSWSEDDKLALLTSKCIYIYDLLANPGNVTTKMNWSLASIHCSEEVNPWQLDMGLDRELLIDKCSSQDLDLINMDKTLSPHMESGRASFRQFVSGEWISPGSLSDIHSDFRRDECLFITLTVDHWVRIYGRHVQDSEWGLLKDISQVVHAHRKKNLWSGSQSKSVASLRVRSYAQATVCFLWVPQFRILLLAQKSGDIFVLDGGFNVKEVLQGLISSEITKMFAVPAKDSFILLLCGSDGRVLGYKIPSKSLKPVPLKKDVWTEPDQMLVSQILLSRMDDKSADLVLGKGPFLIYVRIKGGEAIVEDTLPMGSTPVTGFILCAEDKSLLVMSLNGPLSSVSKDKKVRELKDLGDTTLDMEHYVNKGLIQSRGGALTILVQNVSAYHDHLVLRTPLKLTFLTHFHSPIDALDEVIKSPDFSVKEYKDHIEVGRLLSLKSEENLFVEREEIADPQFLYWYLLFFKCNERRDVAEEELEDVQRCLLKAYIQNDEQGDSLRGSMNEANEFKGVDEKCVICGEAFVQQQLVSSLSCSHGHAFPRCVLTLGVIMTNNLLQCRWCKALAHPESNPSLKIPCPLCGGPFDK